MTDTSNCPVCDSKLTSRQIFGGVARLPGGLEVQADWLDRLVCPSCGIFALNRQDEVNLSSPRLRTWNPRHLSALIREQCLKHLPPFWLRDETERYSPSTVEGLTIVTIQELLRRWPRTVSERIVRCLCNIARMCERGGHVLTFALVPGAGIADIAALFAEDPAEANYHAKALVRLGFLEERLADGFGVSITPQGWSRFEQLTASGTSRENPVFVAMWFGGPSETEAMQKLYDTAISPGIECAGYKAVRVDLVEHNEYIMDEVLGSIRRAPFVVADFTAHRNGVYYEAGFARWLGIPVIHTCRADNFDQAHFDTKQLNHIVWNTSEELRLRLRNRILGTIGAGPFPL